MTKGWLKFHEMSNIKTDCHQLRLHEVHRSKKFFFNIFTKDINLKYGCHFAKIVYGWWIYNLNWLILLHVDNNNNNLVQVDSGSVNVWSTPLSESRHRCLWALQITITLTMSGLQIFCNRGLKNCWHGWSFEPTTLDLSSQSGAFAAMVTT